jgi:hypothetical protein
MIKIINNKGLIVAKFLNQRHYRTSNLQEIKITPMMHQILIGIILGDLFIEKASMNHNARLTFRGSLNNRLYIEHLYTIFQDFCGTPPKEVVSYDTRLSKAPQTTAIRFNTYSSSIFNVYRDRFYKEKIKIVPLDLIQDFTEISLAY